MQPVWLCILWSRQFEETFENPWWRKEKQMQSLWLCIPFAKEFEESFRNALWRKVKQMQPLRLCIDSGKQFEETPYWLYPCILIPQGHSPPRVGVGDVSFEVTSCCEEEFTLHASEGLLSWMCQFVFLEVTICCAFVFTLLAAEWFYSGMKQNVNV